MSERTCRETRTERFLLEREENGVNEFYVFDVIVDDIVEFHALFCASALITTRVRQKTAYRSPSSGVAHPIEQPMPPYNRAHLLDHKDEQQCASSAQYNVMKLEKKLELEWLLIGHDCLEGEYDDKI